MSLSGGVKRQLPVSPYGEFALTEFAPTSIQLDQVRPQLDRVAHRDYSSFFYPLRYKITGGEETSKSWGRARNRNFIVGRTRHGAKPVSFIKTIQFRERVVEIPLPSILGLLSVQPQPLPMPSASLRYREF